MSRTPNKVVASYPSREEAEKEAAKRNEEWEENKKAEKAARVSGLSNTFLVKVSERTAARIHAALLEEVVLCPPGERIPSRTAIVNVLIEEALTAREASRAMRRKA